MTRRAVHGVGKRCSSWQRELQAILESNQAAVQGDRGASRRAHWPTKASKTVQ